MEVDFAAAAVADGTAGLREYRGSGSGTVVLLQ